RTHQTGRARPRAHDPEDRDDARGSRPSRPRPVVHLPAHVARARRGLEMLTAGLVRAAELALPSIPTSLAPPLASAAGTVAWATSPQRRAAVRANLEVVAPDRCSPAMVRRVFVEQALNYLEIFRIQRLGAATIRAIVEKRGWESFTGAVAQGRGV